MSYDLLTMKALKLTGACPVHGVPKRRFLLSIERPGVWICPECLAERELYRATMTVPHTTGEREEGE